MKSYRQIVTFTEGQEGADDIQMSYQYNWSISISLKLPAWIIKYLGRMATFTEDQGLFCDLTSHCESVWLLSLCFNSDFYSQSLSEVVWLYWITQFTIWILLESFDRVFCTVFQCPLWHMNAFKEHFNVIHLLK